MGKEWFIYYTAHPTNLNEYVCRFCPNNSRTLTQVLGAGCGNLGKHMRSQHPEEIIPFLKHHRGMESKGNTLDNYASFVGPRISQKGLNIYNWLELVIFEDLPLSFVDHPMVRKHCKMASISSKWLRKIFLRVGYLVTQKIAKRLPKSFSLMIDGWTAPHCLDHYVGVIALYTENGELKCPVLACSPMESIANFVAEAHSEYIVDTLGHYGKDYLALDCIIADNCATNGALANLLNVPIVGCASHRLNKAAQEYYNSDPGMILIIDNVQDLMVNLRTLKNASILRTIVATKGVLAKTRNATRWSSEFWMLIRFLELYPHLFSCGLSVETLSTYC